MGIGAMAVNHLKSFETNARANLSNAGYPHLPHRPVFLQFPHADKLNSLDPDELLHCHATDQK